MTFTLDHIVDSLAGVLTSRYSAYFEIGHLIDRPL